MEKTAMKTGILNTAEEKISKFKKAVIWATDEIRWCVRVIISSCDRFYWDNGFSKAAGLAYTTLLSLVPVMALAFSILATFVVQNESVPEIRDFIIRIIRQFTPTTDAVNTVLEYLTNFSRTISSLNELAVVFLVFTTILLLNSVEYALNEIWQVYEARSIPHRIARFCAIIVITPVLAISAYYTTRRFTLNPIITDLEGLDWVISIYNYLMPFLVDYAAFFFLYYLIPKAPVRITSASFGALLAALLFGFAKDAFAIYVVKFSSHAAVYGTLAAIPIFLFWLYLAWTIVLLGAESSYQAQYLPKMGKLWKKSILSVGDARLLLAMQALVLIGKAFKNGERVPSDLEIAEKLGCSSVVLKPAIDLLENADIIVRGDSREMPLTLLKAPEKIRVIDIKNALYRADSDFLFPTELTKVFESFNTAKSGQKLTLADII
jgi:membrane protein